MDRSSRSDSDDLRCSDLRRGQAGRSPVGCYVLGTQPHRIGWNLCQEQVNVLPRICETACKAALKKAEYKSSAKKCIQLGCRRFAQNIVPSVDKGTHGLQRPICFCTLLSSLTVAPLRLAHSPRAEANIFSANFLGTWRLEISAQARPQDESLLDVSLRRERSIR